MKYIKYITMGLLVGLFAACSDKDVTYDMTQADNSTKAFVQIFNMAPIANSAANYAYMVDINGFQYQNDYASTLLPRNGIPSGGTNLFFTVDAGTLSIKLYKKENVLYQQDGSGLFYVDGHGVTTRINAGDMVHVISGDGVIINGVAATGHFNYDPSMNLVGKIVRNDKYTALERFKDDPYYVGSTQVAAGKRYHVFIYDMSKDPMAIEMDEIPETMPDVKQVFDDVTDIIGAGSYGKFYNFLYESEGVPFSKKLQTYLKNPESGEYDVKYGEPFGFGEGTKWTVIPFKKSVYNSSGYARVDYKFHVIGANGNDEGLLKKGAANNTDVTDYWTYYVGRAYTMFVGGVRDCSGVAVFTPRWTSM